MEVSTRTPSSRLGRPALRLGAQRKSGTGLIPARCAAAQLHGWPTAADLSARLVTTVRHHLAPPAADVQRLHELWHRVATRAIRIQFSGGRRARLSVTARGSCGTTPRGPGRPARRARRCSRQKEARDGDGAARAGPGEVADARGGVALQARGAAAQRGAARGEAVRQAAMGRLTQDLRRDARDARRRQGAAAAGSRDARAAPSRRRTRRRRRRSSSLSRLARARGAELRQRHYARAIAGAMREHIEERRSRHPRCVRRPPPRRGAPSRIAAPRAPSFVRSIARLAVQARCRTRTRRAGSSDRKRYFYVERGERGARRLDQGAARHERRAGVSWAGAEAACRSSCDRS